MTTSQAFVRVRTNVLKGGEAAAPETIHSTSVDPRASVVQELRQLVRLEEQHRAVIAHASVHAGRGRVWRFRGACKVALLLLNVVLAAVCMLRFVGFGTLTVHGGSMGSVIPSGSVVLTRATPSTAVRVGDVILLPNKDHRNTPVIHRVMSVQHEDNGIVVTSKGDANRAADPWRSVLEPTTQHKVLVIPWLGYALGLLGTPFGWALLVLVPGGWLCASLLRRIWSGKTTAALRDVSVASA